MRLAELKTILDATGYPVAYSHFSESTSLPFITYIVAFSSNFMADNKVYQKISNAQVELYTDYKDLTAEQTLEDLFYENDIAWDVTETYIDSERMYQRIYEIGVI